MRGSHSLALPWRLAITAYTRKKCGLPGTRLSKICSYRYDALASEYSLYVFEVDSKLIHAKLAFRALAQSLYSGYFLVYCS